MTALALPAPILVPASRMWTPTAYARERLGHDGVLDLLHRINVLAMAGSAANFLSLTLANLTLGKTAYAGATTVYGGLWTSALDDTFNGGTTGESAYTSYVRMALTNNTTNFAAGTGSTTYTKTFPSDAAHSWPTSTGGSSTLTYLGFLDGNAGTSADHGLLWCSITSTTINSGDTPQLAQNSVTVVWD